MKTIKKLATVFPVILFFIFVLFSAWSNDFIFKDNLKALPEQGYYGVADEFEDDIKDNDANRDFFIGLNGRASKLFGIKEVNNRYLLKNGMLAKNVKYYDTTELADSIAELSDNLKEQNISFTCLAVPCKENYYSAEFYPGYNQNGRQSMLEFSSRMKQKNINYIDIDSYFVENNLPIEQVYFVTDHHWKPETAFMATKLIMQNFDSIGAAKYDAASLDEGNWNFEVYQDWFLGSHGKRTGEKFAGVDDLTYIYPKTQYNTRVIRANVDRIIDLGHKNTVYSTEYLNNANYYADNPYCLYLGGDYPYIYMKTENAVNNKTLVTIGDSYRLPVDSFLTTQFSEVYHIDLRHYTDGNVMELISEINPDCVLLLFNGPVDADNNCNDFKLDEWNNGFKNRTKQSKIKEISEVSFDTETSVVIDSIKPGYYEMDVKSLVTDDANGENHMATRLALVRNSDDERISNRIFISSYSDSQKWLFKVPDDGNSYSIIAYNGAYGMQDLNAAVVPEIYGKHTEIRGIKIFEYK